jgi:predicted Zn-dependent protease
MEEDPGTRRGFLRSACRHCMGLAGLAGGGLALAQAIPGTPVPDRFVRPATDTDEGGLWAMMDREETRMKRSPLVMRDAVLSAYLTDLVCKLVGEHCPDVRVYVVRTPQFNASMAPNGMMQIWSGMLLRVDNEAQLVAILGHEAGHYLQRHTLQALRDAKGKSAAAMVLGMFGVVGALASLGMAASLYSFSREQEAQADRIGMQLMQKAGYDGREFPLVWDNLVAELQVTGGADAGKRNALFASHPAPLERRDALREMAGDRGGRVGTDELERVVAPHRMEWLREEIRRGQYEESLELFDRKLKLRPDDAQFLYARGEVRRLRDQEEDLDPALQDFQRGAAAAGAPPDLFRSLGLLHKRRGDKAGAAAAFEKYLALVPDAGDAGLIKNYLSELQS